jgi:hypothetical protein
MLNAFHGVDDGCDTNIHTDSEPRLLAGRPLRQITTLLRQLTEPTPKTRLSPRDWRGALT